METKERILEKANELYFRYGVRSITMDEIAAQCGMSKKTIYQFFEDKDALVAAVMDKEMTDTKNRCLYSQQESENAIHEVFLAMQTALKLFDSMHATLMFDLQKHHPESYNKIQQHKSKFLYQITKDNIERGQQEGLYRKELNAEIMASVRLETTFMAIRGELVFPKNHYSASQIIIEMTDHFLYGMATEEGLKLIEKYKQESKTK
jgi:TetR/AcrR family transcriptional regulator, cholesterol catabolism regulator